MSNPFLRNHISVATTVCHIITGKKSVKIELPFTSPPQFEAALAVSSVHLHDCLAGSLFLICFSQRHPLQFLKNSDFSLSSSHLSFLLSSTYPSFCLPSLPYPSPHLFLGSVLIFASAPPGPQYLFCPPLVPRFRLSPTNRDCVTSWLEPSSFG